jgi:hypothetical protein
MAETLSRGFRGISGATTGVCSVRSISALTQQRPWIGWGIRAVMWLPSFFSTLTVIETTFDTRYATEDGRPDKQPTEPPRRL